MSLALLKATGQGTMKEILQRLPVDSALCARRKVA